MFSFDTVFSLDRIYRYTLWRGWVPLMATPGKYVMFIGLNPSTADELTDDNTVRRCTRFARAWGYDALCMTNAFAYRATDPKKMKAHPEPVGPDNDQWLKACALDASLIVVAWGKDGLHLDRGRAVEELLIDYQLYCLGTNSNGTPKHPLYLPNATTPILYKDVSGCYEIENRVKLDLQALSPAAADSEK